MPADDHIAPGNIFQNSAIPYKFANVKTVCRRLETTPFRPSWFRTPGRMQNTYGNECFMDELAVVANADPIEFRLRYLDPDERGIEVLNRAAALANGTRGLHRNATRVAMCSAAAASHTASTSWRARTSRRSPRSR